MVVIAKQTKNGTRFPARPTGKKVDVKAFSREVSAKFPKTIAKLAE